MIKNILNEQNRHWFNEKKEYVKREKFQILLKYLPLKQVITITGIRRCGKSTLAKMAINHLIENGTNPINILFVNLEQPYFLEYQNDATFLDKIYEEYLKLLNPTGKTYVIFDEIQFFDNWEVFIKSKYESSDIKFIVTGSNSSMLSSELATLLTGRSLNIHLDTFSFKEFLDYKKIDYSSELMQIKNRIDIARAKEEYLKWGGFYEIFEIEDEFTKKNLLISYAKNIIYRDIVPRYNIRNSQTVEKLFFYLLNSATTILNYTTLSNTFELSDKTIKEYISYFEETFAMKRMDRYHTKPKERIKSVKKIYIKDNGFLQIAPKKTPNFGTLLENSIYNYLSSKTEEISYMNDTYEIDFYDENTLFQVSYNLEDEKTKQRELRSFEYFKKENQKAKLITFDTDEKMEGIEIISFERFILNDG
ncbi:ATP-binding protein [Aliarcobacter butzleri]|uniref:ATP-binding protein n=1 Tax=Aliarcobacter butzleri TaxID=28197 RepID=UPI001D0280DB|nr:ATP-binding protein [Aliarcobacter butzleri]MDH1975519.1 ATP-binding protein [Aliarcobacter butzleri]